MNTEVNSLRRLVTTTNCSATSPGYNFSFFQRDFFPYFLSMEQELKLFRLNITNFKNVILDRDCWEGIV